MSLPDFKTGSPMVDRALGYVRAAFRALELQALSRLPYWEGTIGTSDTSIPHGLGAPPRGRLVIYQSADARIWDGTASRSPREFVNLRASASVTARIIFF